MKHRFGTQKKPPVPGNFLLSMAVFFVVLFLFWHAVSLVAEHTDDEEKQILERAIQRGIVHCYTLEGSYPGSLRHLKENYGLIWDEDRFFIDYHALGSNIMPEVIIIDRRSLQ